MEGKMIILSAPSGSGKTTIMKHLLDQDLNLCFSVSACTRKPRTNEVDGRDYYFMPVEEFRKKIDAGAFVEWEEVFPGSYYGTLKSEVQRIWEQGRHVVFDVDVVGGARLKNYFRDRALAVFVRVPSLDELEKRLRRRSTDTEEVIRNRLEKARSELQFESRFDAVLVNDQLDKAQEEATRLVRHFLQQGEEQL